MNVSSKIDCLKCNNSSKTIKMKHLINASEAHNNNAKYKYVSSRILIIGPIKKRNSKKE